MCAPIWDGVGELGSRANRSADARPRPARNTRASVAPSERAGVVPHHLVTISSSSAVSNAPALTPRRRSSGPIDAETKSTRRTDLTLKGSTPIYALTHIGDDEFNRQVQARVEALAHR